MCRRRFSLDCRRAADNAANGVIKMQITQRQFFIPQFNVTRTGQRTDRRSAVDCASIDLATASFWEPVSSAIAPVG